MESQLRPKQYLQKHVVMQFHPGQSTYIAGNLKADPIQIQGPSGDFTFFEVVTHRFSYLKGHWERRPETIWALVSGADGEFCRERLREGFPVALDGIVGPGAAEPLVIVHQLHFLGLENELAESGDAPKSGEDY